MRDDLRAIERASDFNSGLAILMFAAAVINGIAGHYEASALNMIACALFWGQA